MKTSYLSFLLCSLTYLTFGQYNSDNLNLRFSYDGDGVEETESVHLENLQIFPIYANEVFKQAHESLGEYTPLKEAIERNDINISEVSTGGEVNRLMATNQSDDTIYIMEGDVVQGGKQDRVVAQDVILAPGEKVDLSAFCVEPGRWSADESHEFGGYFGISSTNVRKAVALEKDQGAVWDSVAVVTEENNAGSTTGAYTQLNNSEEFQRELKRYEHKFNQAYKDDESVVGVVAVTGNKIIGCDIFATHDLFRNAI